MAIKITAVRLEGGKQHEHIVRLWWTNPATSATGVYTTAEVVAKIENEGAKFYVEDAQGNKVDVGVVKPASGTKYVRTHADGKWTDNLLDLPRR